MFRQKPRQFTVLAELIDGAGEVTLEVIVSRLENDQVMYRQARRLNFGNRLEVQVHLHVTECSFPAAGTYEIALRMNGNRWPCGNCGSSFRSPNP